MQTRRAVVAGLAALPFAGKRANAATALRDVRVGGMKVKYLVRLAGPSPAPMLLCFGGGDARRGIAEYYDAVYTPETVYRDHHVIVPIGAVGLLFARYDDEMAQGLVAALTAAEPIAGRGLISDVSNGGRAAFRFAKAAPEAFRGFVTMPGAMAGSRVPDAWADYAILLAYGTGDPGWQAETERAFATLDGRVGAVERMALEGQGHVVAADYDIDPVYARLRDMEARLGR